MLVLYSLYLQSIWQKPIFSTLKFGCSAAMICHAWWLVQAFMHTSSHGAAKAVRQVQPATSKRSFSLGASAEPPSFQCWFNYLLVWSCIAIYSDAARSYSGPHVCISIDTPNSAMVAAPVPVPGPACKHLPLKTLSIYTHSVAAPVASTRPLIRPHSASSLTPSQHSQFKVISTRHVKSSVLTPSLTQKYQVLNGQHFASPSSSIQSAHRRQTASPIIDIAPPPGMIFIPSPSTLRLNAPDHPPAIAVPSLSPHVSGCCKSEMMRLPGSKNCSCVYPIRLQLLILNVSTSFKNWSAEFQQELASQLGLSVAQFELKFFYFVGINELNMSMDIAPLTGVSFSYSQAYRINFTLVTHKLHFNKSLFGDYRLLNFTWLEPAALSPANPIPAQGISPAFATHFLPRADAGVSSSRNKRPSLALLLGISASVIVTIVLSIVIIRMCSSNQGKKSRSDQIQEEKAPQKPVNVVSNDGSFPHPANTRTFAYEELQEATNNFGPANMLGEGGFGRVFKGVLRDGTAVAIKKISSSGRQGGEEFLVEVEMLSRLHHRNLVKLVGCHRSHDSSQHLLCYEFVSNGSLEAWLHGSLGENHPLDWATRMKIALDAARGLAYLHEDCQPSVIHRDFKASNILLEKDFHAKVSDFGLAKQAPQGSRNYVSTRVMGTFGYVAPEYAMTGHLLVKSDVYSYGVVLLELLSARKPVDMSQPSGHENLVTWARPILRDTNRLEELVDPRLDGMYPKEDFAQVCAIASACVAPEASQRPLMGEVVQSLKMVQRACDVQQSVGRGEFADTLTDASHMPSWQNIRPVSTAFESDGSSSVFSSGPFSGLSGFDNYNLSRHVVSSEDLQEGR